MTIQPKQDAFRAGESRCACRTLLPLLALLLGACTQLTPPPGATQAQTEATSHSTAPGQGATDANWAAEKRAAEERAAALWAADQLRAKKREEEDLAAERLAVAMRDKAKGRDAKSSAGKSATSGKPGAEFLAIAGNVVKKAEPEQSGGEPPAAEEQLTPVATKDWSEVKYPWEEGASLNDNEQEPQSPAVKQEGEAAEEQHGEAAEEQDGEAAEERPSQLKGEAPATTGIDWSKVKYPWEKGATPAQQLPSEPDEGEQEAAIAMAEVAKAAPAKPMTPPPRRTKRPPSPLKVQKVAIGKAAIEMVNVPGGNFMMGSATGDYDERPIHAVEISAFQIGRYEVTQRQWVAVMGDNPSFFSKCADCPVDNVSWDDIQRFIERLNQRTGRDFRLPSEAEWEYACRAGEGNLYCGGSDETLLAWYGDNSGGRSQPAGSLEPNAFGLYDMSGNVYEWVADCWHDSYGKAPDEGAAWLSGSCQRRVLRGGAWYYSPRYATASYRNANIPSSRFIIYGFRLAHDSM